MNVSVRFIAHLNLHAGVAQFLNCWNAGMYRRTLVLFTLVAGAVMAEQAIAQTSRPQPSFNCAKVGTSVELMICADTKLAGWDGRMGQAYKLRLTQLVRDAEGRRTLVEAQRQWVSSRNERCNQTQLTAVKPCILEMTKARLEALQKPDSAITESRQPASVLSASAIAQTSVASVELVRRKRTASAEFK